MGRKNAKFSIPPQARGGHPAQQEGKQGQKKPKAGKKGGKRKKAGGETGEAPGTTGEQPPLTPNKRSRKPPDVLEVEGRRTPDPQLKAAEKESILSAFEAQPTSVLWAWGSDYGGWPLSEKQRHDRQAILDTLLERGVEPPNPLEGESFESTWRRRTGETGPFPPQEDEEELAPKKLTYYSEEESSSEEDIGDEEAGEYTLHRRVVHDPPQPTREPYRPA